MSALRAAVRRGRKPPFRRVIIADGDLRCISPPSCSDAVLSAFVFFFFSSLSAVIYYRRFPYRRRKPAVSTQCNHYSSIVTNDFTTVLLLFIYYRAVELSLLLLLLFDVFMVSPRFAARRRPIISQWNIPRPPVLYPFPVVVFVIVVAARTHSVASPPPRTPRFGHHLFLSLTVTLTPSRSISFFFVSLPVRAKRDTLLSPYDDAVAAADAHVFVRFSSILEWTAPPAVHHDCGFLR